MIEGTVPLPDEVADRCSFGSLPLGAAEVHDGEAGLRSVDLHRATACIRFEDLREELAVTACSVCGAKPTRCESRGCD